jgi:hypothetical protein
LLPSFPLAAAAAAAPPAAALLIACALLLYTAFLLSSNPLQAAATCGSTLLPLLLLLPPLLLLVVVVAAAAMPSRISRIKRLYPLIRPSLLLLLSSVLDPLRVRLLLLLVAFFVAAFPPFLGFSCNTSACTSTRPCQ